MRASGRCVAALAAVSSLALLSACRGTTTKAADSTVVVTVTPTPRAHPSSSTPPPRRPSPGTLSTQSMRQLPGECVDVLSRSTVAAGLGVKKLTGPTVFIVGQGDPTINRLSYINCRYGGEPNQDEPNIEIQVSLYTTAAKAASRLPANTTDFEQHGARATKVTVGGRPATLLIGGHGKGYYPTIALAVGNRTVAVSLKPGVVPSAELHNKLIALGDLAAKRTASP